jgi:AraC-like DNA-binding protein
MNDLTLPVMRDSLGNHPVLSHRDDFFIMTLPFHAGMERHLTFPYRFAGVICLYCIEGQFDLQIGMDEYAVTRDCFAISLPEDILSFSWKESCGPGKITIMAISEQMLQEMEFDRLGAIYAFRCRMVKVDRRTKILIHNFHNIFRSVTGDRHADVTRSLGYLLRSMSIELTRIWDRMAGQNSIGSQGSLPITRQFIALISRYHTEHRDSAFYAVRLGVTPKYLSAVIREDTGRTAIEWIAEYVLMEACYYLRYTSRPVKEIAWLLNFKNQMDFYRYFQRHIGLTPTAYRGQMGEHNEKHFRAP